jgi:hypothetical protein
MNRRKTTKGLNTNQVKELNVAWHHARRLGLPCNLFITFRPLEIDAMNENERCRQFAAVRNKLGVYARQHGFPATFVWSREINTNGTGEHMHVLIHAPSRRRLHFQDVVMRWFPDAHAIDVRPAHAETKFTAAGRQLNAISYISKQMTPQAWFKRGLNRQAGGPILGKRGGVSANLTWKAIAAWQREAAVRQTAEATATAGNRRAAA